MGNFVIVFRIALIGDYTFHFVFISVHRCREIIYFFKVRHRCAKQQPGLGIFTQKKVPSILVVFWNSGRAPAMQTECSGFPR